MRNRSINFCLLLNICWISIVTGQQSAYYDAMFIYDSCFNKAEDEFIKQASLFDVLRKYYPPGTKFNTDTLKSNPFFKRYTPDGFEQGSVGSTFKDAFTSVGNLNVTNFADGLAKFLVARAKEELNVAFFTKLQGFLKKYPEIKVVFPNTYGFLDDIYAYQYAAMLPALRAGFQLDMDDFSENLIRIREMTETNCTEDTTQKCKERVEEITAFLDDHLAGRSIIATLMTSNSIMKGVNAADIIDEIVTDKIITGHDDNFSNTIHFANLLSSSLRSANHDAIWVSKTELKTLLTNGDVFRIYLGLIYAMDGLHSKNIAFSKSDSTKVTLKNLLAKADTVEQELNILRQSISAFGNVTEEVSSLAKRIVRAEEGTQQSGVMVYADYARAISDMLKQGVTFFGSSLPKVEKDVETFTTVIDLAVDGCYDIKTHNYGSLVLHTSQIMELILDKKYTYKDDFIKYGSFMAGIIGAETSDEVKAAIEAAVLPVGSASIKRQTISNISLNGYIGGMAGYEYLGGLTEDQWAPILGVTAPVGVAFSWGRLGNGTRKDPPKTKWKCGNVKGGKSFTLFVPLIDVGAIATFRFADETSNVAAEVKLENIIAPGLYGYWGFGKVPVSAGFGIQVGPQLREINAEAINVDQNFYLRFGLNVVVDIPFFNFYTRN